MKVGRARRMDELTTRIRELDDEALVSNATRYLIQNSGKSILQVSEEAGINYATLYSMVSRRSNKADVRILKRLADYFEVDISIFCGIKEYAPPIQLSEEEHVLVNNFRELNEKGRERVSEYISDVVSNPANRRK